MQLRAAPHGPLAGTITLPGDKSISHRSLMFAALARGTSEVTGLLEGEDVLSTASALRRLGVTLERLGPGHWRVEGLGVGALREPGEVLDLGNAGTGARLLMGLLAGQGFSSFMSGDASLRGRPMARVIEPLSRMGAGFISRSGNRLPLVITGRKDLTPITHRSKVASAQVKSAILLAGLHATGRTVVIEPQPSRDHSERMLSAMGARIESIRHADGSLEVSIEGPADLVARPMIVPGDPSSAAFPAVAAAITAGAEVLLPGVCLNPLRAGLYQTLAEMGADLTVQNRRQQAGEEVGDLLIRGGRLEGITVPAERAPTMIDEYPVLAVAAAFARGRTVMHGLGELKVKESDRLAAVANGLAACGVRVEVDGETLIVEGGNGAAGGVAIDAHLDHRIAMAFLVLGGAAEAPITVEGAETIETSFPDFRGLMNGLGARIEVVEGE